MPVFSSRPGPMPRALSGADAEGDAEETGEHAAAHQQQVVGGRLARQAGKVHQPGHGPQSLQARKPPMISVDCGA
jgi:hypothetical protein